MASLTRARTRAQPSIFSATHHRSSLSYSRDAALTKRSKKLRRCVSDLEFVNRRNGNGFFHTFVSIFELMNKVMGYSGNSAS